VRKKSLEKRFEYKCRVKSSVLFCSVQLLNIDLSPGRETFHLDIKIHTYKSNGNFNRSADEGDI